MKSLVVKYNDQVIGRLWQNEYGRMSFQYDNHWLMEGFAVSISLPLQQEIFSEQQCRPFFEGLLPEGEIRNEIARNLRVSVKNDFALLREIGGDCAGAITIGESKEKSLNAHNELLEGEKLIEALKPLNGKPLLAGEKDVRLSIAGSQRKLPVIYENGDFFIPHGDIPTTFIIKPEIAGIEGSVDNELYCLALARKIKLATPNFDGLQLPELIKTNGNVTTVRKKYLLLERYDRKIENGKVARLHQEDLCQAIGVPSENKYQKDGGPSFKDLFTIIKNHSSQPALDTRSSIRIALFNYLIGNADAHGKNFSFLFTKNSVTLAPFYDLLSTEIYPNLSTKMAMKIGGEYKPDDIFRRHWHRFAEENSINQKLMDKEIDYVSKAVSKWYKHTAQQLYWNQQLYPKVINEIIKLIEKKLKLLERG
ncbi:MAG: type II toxin-antitoxin system HipA family toxin [Holosporaceae bacterium]|jgi:serine/threonine-protein kinase HipA|nr:type II toxin-antitoxin system HipA family toxin [Holosporaceae bacterium]